MGHLDASVILMRAVPICRPDSSRNETSVGRGPSLGTRTVPVTDTLAFSGGGGVGPVHAADAPTAIRPRSPEAIEPRRHAGSLPDAGVRGKLGRMMSYHLHIAFLGGARLDGPLGAVARPHPSLALFRSPSTTALGEEEEREERDAGRRSRRQASTARGSPGNRSCRAAASGDTASRT